MSTIIMHIGKGKQLAFLKRFPAFQDTKYCKILRQKLNNGYHFCTKSKFLDDYWSIWRKLKAGKTDVI